MEIRSIECPKCKGQLQINVETEKTFCMYCRAEILITPSSEQAEIITSETMPNFENMRAEAVQKLYDTYAGTPWGTFWMFNQIPPNKVANAIKSYGSAIGADETVIFFYDDSLFRNGKSGFFLSTEGFYGKEIPFTNNFCPWEKVNYVRAENSLVIALGTDEGEVLLGTAVPETKQEHTVFVSILHDFVEELKV